MNAPKPKISDPALSRRPDGGDWVAVSFGGTANPSMDARNDSAFAVQNECRHQGFFMGLATASTWF
jgi:hypothetical protein